MRLKKLLLGLLAVVGIIILVPVLFIAKMMLFAEKLPVGAGGPIDQLPSYQDSSLLARAWQLPTAAAMKASFVYQSNPSFCGPTSLTDIEHSIGRKDVTPKQVLAGSGLCWTGMCMGGITLDEAAALARAQGHEAKAVRDLTLAQFREAMKASNRGDRRYSINFNRQPLFGRGGGHHSPIGGYLEGEDLVFVLDVNKSYQPWLVPTERLYDAMNTVDADTHQKRGLVEFDLPN